MRVCIASIVRNGESYLPRYFGQVWRLREMLALRGDVLWGAWAVGESTDSTLDQMDAFAGQLGDGSFVLAKRNSGPVFGSVDDPVRWMHIAKTWNYLFDALAQRGGYDALIYVEADLIWDVGMMVRLLDHLEDVPAVAPLCFGMAGHFYDTWGHRGMDGVHFGASAPYHSSLVGAQGLVMIRSAGSCKVMRGEVALRCRFSEKDAMLGHSIYEKGFTLWLDPSEAVTHP